MFQSAKYSPLPMDPSLRAWYDASRVLGVNTANPANSTALSMVADLSGNSNYLTSSGASQPLYKTNVQNGLGAIHSVDSNDYLKNTISSKLTTSAMYIASVAKSPTTGINKGIYAIHSIDGGLAGQIIGIFGSTGLYGETAINSTTNVGLNGPVYTTATALIEHYWGAGTVSMQINGGTASTVSSTVYQITDAYIMIANHPSLSFGDLHVMEVLMYCRLPSAAERLIIRNYLNAKWSVY